MQIVIITDSIDKMGNPQKSISAGPCFLKKALPILIPCSFAFFGYGGTVFVGALDCVDDKTTVGCCICCVIIL